MHNIRWEVAQNNQWNIVPDDNQQNNNPNQEMGDKTMCIITVVDVKPNIIDVNDIRTITIANSFTRKS